MKQKVQIDYILREVYRQGTMSLNDLRNYCFARNIVQLQEEFEYLIKRMISKKYIGMDYCMDEIYFLKSNRIESNAIGICYNGTKDIIFYHYVS
ncbi:MAG: hypothetical protein Q4F05_17865 [bacterium]|nr:hypothetical protein [bacterium]